MNDPAQPASDSAAPARALVPLVLPPACFANPADAFRTFALKFPVTIEGCTFASIGIRRFTVAQIKAITENFRANLAIDPAATMSLPIYVDEAGQDLPPSVLGLITPDEADDLDEATNDFLPRRFRAAPTAETVAPPPPDGSSTAPSS